MTYTQHYKRGLYLFPDTEETIKNASGIQKWKSQELAFFRGYQDA